MTAIQKRIMYELILGRKLVIEPKGGKRKWADGRAKPPLDAEVVDQLVTKGIIIPDVGEAGHETISSCGTEMLREDIGRR